MENRTLALISPFKSSEKEKQKQFSVGRDIARLKKNYCKYSYHNHPTMHFRHSHTIFSKSLVIIVSFIHVFS